MDKMKAPEVHKEGTVEVWASFYAPNSPFNGGNGNDTNLIVIDENGDKHFAYSDGITWCRCFLDPRFFRFKRTKFEFIGFIK